jgi:pimeloyl-ACP methyl ester carboxylesterase
MHDYNLVVQGVNLRVRVTRADEDSPLVVLLHGFPENHTAWRHQIKPLHDAGWRVAVPDLRGFDQSEKPVGSAAYRLDVLAADVAGIAAELGATRFAVVGHDVGASIAWRTAMDFPAQVSQVVAIAGPHPSVAKLHGGGLPLGMMRLYPVLHEANLSFLNFRSLANFLRAQTRAGAVTDADLDVYRQGWYREGALPAMLSYFTAPAAPAAQGDVRCPALVLRGKTDTWYPAAQVTNPTGGAVVDLDAGHYPHLDTPDAVSRAIVDFLGVQPKRKEWRPPQW